jgi:mRNA interferase RelE/StbE
MKLLLTEDAERDLKRLGHAVGTRIMGKALWLADTFLEHTPVSLGGKFKGLYKLRVGDWRVVYEIDHRRKALVVNFVDHRSKIYKRR